MLLKYGADPNLEANGALPITTTSSFYVGCEFDVEILRMLVESGADVDAVGGDGFNGLLTACLWGDVEAARFFLEHNVDPESVDPEGRSCLDHAGESSEEIVKMLNEYIQMKWMLKSA